MSKFHHWLGGESSRRSYHKNGFIILMILTRINLASGSSVEHLDRAIPITINAWFHRSNSSTLIWIISNRRVWVIILFLCYTSGVYIGSLNETIVFLLINIILINLYLLAWKLIPHLCFSLRLKNTYELFPQLSSNQLLFKAKLKEV